jgi:hypothetical protein
LRMKRDRRGGRRWKDRQGRALSLESASSSLLVAGGGRQSDPGRGQEPVLE